MALHSKNKLTQHDFAAIAQEIRNSPACCGQVRVVGIDGPAGSGKTTLAAGLASELNNCPVIHMDDFYNGWLQDFEFDLGNRLKQEVLNPIANGLPASYKKYDWYAASFNSTVQVPAHPFLILEGVGACNQLVTDFLAYEIWIEADSQLLIDRIISRDGEAMRPHLAGFKTREATYFAKQLVKQRADLELSGN